MFDTIQSLFQRKTDKTDKTDKPEYPGLKMKFQVFWADYGIGQILHTCNTRAEAVKTIQRLAPTGKSYTIREVFVSAE